MGYSNLCRVCLEGGANVPIFVDTENEDSVYYKLCECVGVKIEDIDGHLQNICHNCSLTLDTVYKFLKRFKESNNILKQCEINEKIENIKDEEMEDNDKYHINNDDQTNEDTQIEDEVWTNIGGDQENENKDQKNENKDQKNENKDQKNKGLEPETKIKPIENKPRIEFSDAKQFLELVKPLQTQINKVTVQKRKKKVTQTKSFNTAPKKVRTKSDIQNNNMPDEDNSNSEEKNKLSISPILKSKSISRKGLNLKKKLCVKEKKESSIKNKKALKKENKSKENTHTSKENTENITQTFLCEECGSAHKSHAQLNSHIRKVHKKYTVPCPICSKNYVDEYYLKKHMLRVHSSVKAFVCSLCGTGFSIEGDLRMHRKSVHERSDKPKKKHPCFICKREFALKKYVEVHMRSAHTGERPSICDICGKAFYNDEYLIQHKRLHTGETPFKCPICGRGYAQRCNMKSHIRHVHWKSQIDEETLSKLKPNYIKLLRVK